MALRADVGARTFIDRPLKVSSDRGENMQVLRSVRFPQ